MPGMTAHGLVSPEEARRQLQQERDEQIERTKRYKNKKAAEAARRANAQLANLGLSKAERKVLGKRQRPVQVEKPKNFRWVPLVVLAIGLATSTACNAVERVTKNNDAFFESTCHPGLFVVDTTGLGMSPGCQWQMVAR